MICPVNNKYPLVNRIQLNMYRFKCILHKIITGIWHEEPVIYLPHNARKSRIYFPQHYSTYIVQFMTCCFKNTLITHCVHQLHLIAEILHINRVAVSFNHFFIIKVIPAISGCSIMITP